MSLPPTGPSASLTQQLLPGDAPAPLRHPDDDGEPPPSSDPTQPEKKKKRLTQACQHCRKKKIRCDGVRPSCKNCIKNKSPCTYLPSVRKRGRNNGIRVSMVPPFLTGGPYDRPLALPAPGGSPGAAGGLGASAHQHVHLLSPGLQHQQLPPPPPHQQQPPSLFHAAAQGHGMQPRPQPQINPLRAAFGGGPVSLHLKRDPGFDVDPMGEGMFDPAKQAREMSTHFLQPVNSFRFPQFMPVNPMSLASQAGPSGSNSADRASGATGSSIGVPYPFNALQHPSSAGLSARVDSYGGESTSSMGVPSSIAAPLSSGLQSAFNPMLLAQDLSSAYASVIVGVPPAGQQQHPDAFHANGTEPPLSAPARPSNARGKSASHTPDSSNPEGAAADTHATAKMRDLKRNLRAIISSVWADTECGRSAGMAGVTLEEEEEEDDGQCGPVALSPAPVHGGRPRSDTGGARSSVPPSLLASPQGDRPMETHLINTYFEYVHYQLPIIPRDDFSDAYNRNSVPALLVWAMCAAASVFLNRIEDDRRTIYERYSQKVREQFHDACFEPTLEVVQTALIMTLCEYRQGSLQRAWVYLSMGFRLAIAMGYHHHDAKLRAGPAQSSADIARRETCRRAFWGAFLLDRYTAIGGGKALGINDDDITVLLPLRDKDWQNRSAAPPLSALEFFRPVGPASLSAGRSASVGGAANVAGGGFASRGSSSGTGGFDSDVSSPLTGTSTGSRNSTPTSPTGWDTRLGDVGALGQFIKLMTVVGQVAQHVNGSKGAASPGRRAPLRERPSRGCTMLDAALLRWKEELPPWLSCAEARSADARPEAAVFVLCMHAIYYGAVIMLNRENMGLLRDLPGQLDVSTNLAIRSLERCRVAAMEVVEISHHICSLPSAMTNALLPWALFQAGTLLIHFMIAGSSAQAQEEARAAILSLDCALRDELSRYWSVSSKYHLVLSNMVKAWERARQATPSLTPRQLSGTPGVAGQLQPPLLQVQALAGPVSSESASEAFQAFSTQFQLPMQMQHVPPHMAAALQPRKAEHQSQRQPASGEFATLMKPYAAPASSTARDPAVPAGVLSLRASSTQSAGSSAAHRSAEQRGGAASDKAVGSDPALLPGFVFSADTAQDSLNTLNAFFSQLSQEQARQFSEGLQMYALHGGRSSGAQAEAEPIAADVMLARAPSLPLAAPMEHLQPAAAFDLAGQSHGDSSSSNRHQYSRRDSLPISSNCDLFTAPGEHHLFSASTIQSDRSISASFGQIAGDVLMSSELDPLLFNPMTPFLQELQMFNSPHLHAPSSADTRSAGRPTHSSAGRTDAPSSS